MAIVPSPEHLPHLLFVVHSSILDSASPVAELHLQYLAALTLQLHREWKIHNSDKL